MPVYKYRTVEAMESSVWLDRNDPKLLDRIQSIWRFSAQVAPVRFSPGVHKHRSIADAQAYLEANTVRGLR